MPSFIPRNLQQLPVTPPEYLATQFLPPPPPYSSLQTGVMRSDESGHGYVDRFGQHSYHQPTTYTKPPGLRTPFWHKPHYATLENMATARLPPIHAPSTAAREPTFIQEASGASNEEKTMGGVSARLDYDIELMTDFITDISNTMLQMWLPGTRAYPSFRKWVLQVLSATRLPSSTLFLGLYYLSKRIMAISREAHPPIDEHFISRVVTVALIIGSKFFDDNTFVNRSWSEVSGFDTKLLNQMEREWLVSINYRLHLDDDTTSTCQRFRKHWEEFVKRQTAERSSHTAALSPIDTNFQRHLPSSHQVYTPASTQPHTVYHKPIVQDYNAQSQQSYYPTPMSAQYNHPWNRSDQSPASAPHTGPTTPEYYGGLGAWASNTYDRRTMFYGRQPQPQVHTQPPLPNMAFHNGPFSPNHHQPTWGMHGMVCNCVFCGNNRNVPYYNSWTTQVVQG